MDVVGHVECLHAKWLKIVYMHAVLLEALARSKVHVSRYLAHFQEPIDLATLIHLIHHLVCPALLGALLYALGVIESPALPPVCLAHVLACIAAHQTLCLRTIATPTLLFGALGGDFNCGIVCICFIEFCAIEFSLSTYMVPLVLLLSYELAVRGKPLLEHTVQDVQLVVP